MHYVTGELDFIPTYSLSYFPMLFILVEVAAARNRNSLFGLSCLKNTFFFFLKRFFKKLLKKSLFS